MAIDPGGTSGLAFRMPDGSLVTAKALTDQQVFAYFKADIRRPEQVIIEEWEYFTTRVTPEGRYTDQIYSGVKALCYVLNIPLAIRPPAFRNPNQRIAESWYKQQNHIGRVLKIHSHECDALAHLITWENLHVELQRQIVATSAAARAVYR